MVTSFLLIVAVVLLQSRIGLIQARQALQRRALSQRTSSSWSRGDWKLAPEVAPDGGTHPLRELTLFMIGPSDASGHHQRRWPP